MAMTDAVLPRLPSQSLLCSPQTIIRYLQTYCTTSLSRLASTDTASWNQPSVLRHHISPTLPPLCMTHPIFCLQTQRCRPPETSLILPLSPFFFTKNKKNLLSSRFYKKTQNEKMTSCKMTACRFALKRQVKQMLLHCYYLGKVTTWPFSFHLIPGQ